VAGFPICVFAGLDGLAWQWVARKVDGGTADRMIGPADGETEFRFDGFKDAEGLVHDFRADAVSGENGDAVAA
jgi:hypothetical protein